MGEILGKLQPQSVWNIFEEITKIPRCSKHEEKAVEYIEKFANERNLEIKKDKLGNLVVRKPAQGGMDNHTPVCIQGHIDMVCEKNSDSNFNFATDPIKVYVDGDWVKADGTTLGADNGIGVAMGMAVLDDKEMAHPPFELLVTLDEETGLTGAMQLGTDLLRSKILINLDSEEDGAFTIGCAGGINVSGSFKYESDSVPSDHTAYKINLKGLKGGHSGIEIHDGRANAIKLMTRFLWHLTRKYNARLVDFNGGNKHNAIPRESFAVVMVPNDSINHDKAEYNFEKDVQEFNRIYKAEWESKEPNINLSAEKAETPKHVMTQDLQKRVLLAMHTMPHGPMRMSPDIEGLVQTSTNLAIIETRQDEIFILTSQRSSVETEKGFLADTVRNVLELAGAENHSGDGYPAWEPNVKSNILNVAKDLFKEMRGKDPKIEAIHAGLECGLIGEKYPGMDMLSFGPTLKEVHSPDEKIQVSTVENCWNLLKKILQNIPANNA